MLKRNFEGILVVAMMLVVMGFCASSLHAIGDNSEIAKIGIKSMVK